MMRATQQQQQQQQQTENTHLHQTPPPVPNQQMFHVILDGVQQGPIPISQIQQLIQSLKITPQTMVWSPGMPSWVAANSITELQLFFGAIPPPPPTM
jgi:hypothetical protein